MGTDDSISRLVETVAAEDVEIERKYLLSGLPAMPVGCEEWEIEQGWLPGERLQERLRRTRCGEQELLTRCVKLGRGIARVEVEEECSVDLFLKLWPLTEGCRVHKRRYRIPLGARVWEVDAFLDRPLFLAEVELPSVSSVVTIPDWLAEVVLREVTGESDYINRELAR